MSPTPPSAATLTLTSPSFSHGKEIPSQYTCEGADLSPPLFWKGVPAGTRSLALIVEDPDAPDPAAPKMTWIHWVLYDLPPTSPGLPELPKGKSPEFGRAGENSWKRTDHGGPCPPIGRHRYFFKLYALDTELGDLHMPTRDRLLAAMEGHVLAKAELMGTYQKKGR